MSRAWARRAGTVMAGALVLLALQAPGANALLYDNTSPVSTGCNSGATTPRTAYIVYTPLSINIGRIDLRYSPTCRTTWAHAYSFVTACDANGNGCFYAQDYRNSDGYLLSRTSLVGHTDVWSNQLNDANVTSFASSCMHYSGGYWCANTTSY